MLAVAHAPVVLTPRHFGRIGGEVRAGDMMVNADLGAADAREERLGVIRASIAVAVRLLMVDALRQIAGVQRVPMRRFIGVNGGFGGIGLLAGESLGKARCAKVKAQSQLGGATASGGFRPLASSRCNGKNAPIAVIPRRRGE